MSAPPAQAIILAAGRGSRLRPLTDRTPKPLVQAGGQPLIARGLRLLAAHGIEDVVINVHHLREKIMEELGDGSAWGVRIRYSVEEELLDTGGGIVQAARCAGALPGGPPLLVMNADVVTDIPLSALLEGHQRSKAAITLVLRDDPRAAEYGLFGIDDTGRIRRFLGRGSPPEGLREYMFASVQVLSAEVLESLPAGGAFSTMHGVYPPLFDAGLHFHGFLHSGRWHTSDTAEDLQKLEESLATEGELNFPSPT